jgi:DNA modification methylase
VGILTYTVDEFLGGKITLFGGDNREVLIDAPDNSVESILTDGPYALVSIVKRFGGANAAPAKGNEAYMRASRGFMGQKWDSGEVVNDYKFWTECLRVLKPGGHLLSFGGTRTYHRMACAVEDAGFEIRDMIQWLYGSGFPKSHDVSKGIDKKANEGPLFETIRSHIREWKSICGLDNKGLNDAIGSATNGCGMARHWTSTEGSQHSIPSKEQWKALKVALGWPDCELDNIYDAVKDGAERPVVGKKDATLLAVAPGQDNDRSATTLDITAPATDEAKQWEGWGTALKPANEPIVLARKPLSEKTVAANVLKWGTGAINIDGCRVESDGEHKREFQPTNNERGIYGEQTGFQPSNKEGRFPANVITDGSDEVVAAFPFTKSNPGTLRSDAKQGANVAIAASRREGTKLSDGDSGSAARFFYQAKANKKDRANSKHPTVKPIALMRYLARLITPPGGTILDPFAGSGTTGEAAYLEGFSCYLIEREQEYRDDIAARFVAMNDNEPASLAA